ncbi:MAG TPA: hypothetical protein DGN60_04400, partial [Chloroflexi bacterium]|nr:hypothetical protein [Chloroflexota bacterium]
LVYSRIDHSEGTFFDGINQLPGGCAIELDLESETISQYRYYDIPLGTTDLDLTPSEYTSQFFDIFEDSVRLRLISDVPVGACLSGGLDSSSIVCMVNHLIKHGKKGTATLQKVFSARFKDFAETKYDESTYIDAVVSHTGVNAYSVQPTDQSLVDSLGEIVSHQGQPFGSSSVFAQWEVFRKAREEGVTVMLDGQGGDESLGGYQGFHHNHLASLARKMMVKRFVRESVNLHTIHGNPWIEIVSGTSLSLLPSSLQKHIKMAVRQKQSPWISQDFSKTYRNLDRYDSTVVRTDPFHQSLYRSFFTGLPPLLRFEDHNSMAHSIESRLPFLDHRLVEWLFSTPSDTKISHGTTKVILRDSMKDLLPNIVNHRQDKIGFNTPEDTWFRGKLKGLVENLVISESFSSRHFFNHDMVKEYLNEHMTGKQDHSFAIWRWMDLELWLRKFID